MKYFVDKQSIVRRIWGNGDTILFIFAGAAAEFALNKAVDWLYFTGRLPAEPLKRLFSTVAYARQIVFSESEEALSAIDKIATIHKGVEDQRGMVIPDWAYRDVLYMLIDYSIRSFELLERRLSTAEKRDIFAVFHNMGTRMGVKDFPESFEAWRLMRAAALEENLEKGHFTVDLYKQYRKHLGWLRFVIVKQVQTLLLPEAANRHLGLGHSRLARLMLNLYKLSGKVGLKAVVKNMLLPKEYKQEIIALDYFT